MILYKPKNRRTLAMAGIRFTLEQQELLGINPNIEKISEKSITYKDTFKLMAIEEYAMGKTPSEIFKQAGINPEIIGVKNPTRCLERWKKSYFKQGDVGLIGEKRGCSRNGRHKVGDLTIEERLRAAEAKIAYLEMENQFLKKLEELERRLSK